MFRQWSSPLLSQSLHAYSALHTLQQVTPSPLLMQRTLLQQSGCGTVLVLDGNSHEVCFAELAGYAEFSGLPGRVHWLPEHSSIQIPMPPIPCPFYSHSTECSVFRTRQPSNRQSYQCRGGTHTVAIVGSKCIT